MTRVAWQGEYAMDGALERRLVARRSEDGDFAEIKLANDTLDDTQVYSYATFHVHTSECVVHVAILYGC